MDNPNRSFRLGTVILAAGGSSRMGRPKLLLPWGNGSVLAHLLAEWRRLNPEQVAVVHPGPGSSVEEELNRLSFESEHRIVNMAPERGMFSSIQAAAAWPGWQEGLTHWAIVLGDQPQLRWETLRKLVGFAAAHPESICQPSRDGNPRHPVILPAEPWERLGHTSEPTLKHFLQNESAGVKLCEMDDPGLNLDLDTPADYERVWREYFGSKP